MLLGPIIGNVFSKVNSSLSGLGSGSKAPASAPVVSSVHVTGTLAGDCAATGVSHGTMYSFLCSDGWHVSASSQIDCVGGTNLLLNACP
jgi:hypothetical protein